MSFPSRGLAMVYSTMRRHSADLEIDSAPGKGTTVRLSFVAATTTAAGRPGAGAAHTTSTPLRILVVDDDPLLPKSLRDTLETAGHQVVTAAGGQAGVDSFREALVGGKPFSRRDHQPRHALRGRPPGRPRRPGSVLRAPSCTILRRGGSGAPGLSLRRLGR